MARRLRSILLAGLASSCPGALPGQTPPPDSFPRLAELPLRRVLDADCRLDEFTRAAAPSAEQARAVVEALIGPAASPPRGHEIFYWIAYLPTRGPGTVSDTLATRVYDAARDRLVEGEKLYEAEELRLVLLLPHPEAGSTARTYATRAATLVREERGLLASGFPGFLAEVLGGLVRRAAAPGCERPFRTFDVAVHVTPIEVPDATLLTRIEVDVSPTVDAERPGAILDEFRRRRVEIEARYIGYTALGAIFDAVELVLAGPDCSGQAATECLRSVRAAAVETMAASGLTAEHAITAAQKGTQQALAIVEAGLAAARLELSRRWRVVDRPLIGFSVGGILAEGSGDKLKFDVEDGRIVADGIEGEGFKSVALVDLYFRRVDLGESAPGFVPHASIGFTIGEVLRPGVFLATTLPFTEGRLALFGGGILRKETTTELPPGTEVEPGSRPIRERYRFPLVAGLKVGLPF